METQTATQDAGTRATPPVINTRSLIAGTMVSTDLDRARAMLENAFGLKCVRATPDLLVARDRGYGPGEPKHGRPYWVLEVSRRDEVAVEQEMLNHWGMAAPSEAAVDEAFAKLKDNKDEFGIKRVQKPIYRNGSYAFYFVDVDSNWWELEYRSPEITYEVLRRAGDVA